eukprot:5359541-Pyramimonas_sp.AAC.1
MSIEPVIRPEDISSGSHGPLSSEQFRSAAPPTPVELLPYASGQARQHIEEWDRRAQTRSQGAMADDTPTVNDEEMLSAYCETFET